MSKNQSTQFESQSLGSSAQKLAGDWTNSKKHPFVGFIGGRAIGVLVKPSARIVDCALQIILGLGKLSIGIFATLPAQIAAKVIGKDYQSSWTVKQGIFHLGWGIIYALDIFVSPVVNVISPNLYDRLIAAAWQSKDDSPPFPSPAESNGEGISALRDNLVKAQEELNVLNEKLQALSDIGQEKNRLDGEVGRLVAEKYQLIRQINDYEEKTRAEQKVKDEELQRLYETLKVAHQNLIAVEQQQVKIDQLEEANRSLLTECEKQKKENEQLQSRIKEISLWIISEQKGHTLIVSELNRHLDQNKLELQSLDSGMKTLKDIFDKQVAELNNERDLVGKRDVELREKTEQLQKVQKEKDDALNVLKELQQQYADLQSIAASDAKNSNGRQRVIGRYIRWMFLNIAAGSIKLSDKLKNAFQKRLSTNDAACLTDSVLGHKCISELEGTLSIEDFGFLLDCYRKYLLEEVKQKGAGKVLELNEQDIADLRNILGKSDREPPHHAPLEEMINLPPEDFRAAEEVKEPNGNSKVDILPDLSKSTLLSNEKLDSLADEFKEISAKESDTQSLVHYELVEEYEGAVPGLSKIEREGKMWLQYITRPTDGIKGIRICLSDQLLAIYDQLLEMNDHSYAVANVLTKTDKVQLEKVYKRHDQLNVDLESKKWQDSVYAFGATGKDNRDLDIPCVFRHNLESKTIAVTFHGSRNGSKIPVLHNGQGDWGANYDAAAVLPKDIQLDIETDVLVHRGFANNVQSVQDAIQRYLETHLGKLSESEQRKYRVVFTGHSKGAAEANIAALMAKEFLDKKNIPSRVGAVVFSSPRAFFGDEAQEKVDKKLGFLNIIRVNVYGDPVANVPITWQGGKSAGLLVLDDIQKVRDRLLVVAPQLNGNENYKEWFIQKFAGYHYGSSMRGAGLEFDPRIVMKKEELLDGLLQGLKHMIDKNHNPIRRVCAHS